MTKKAFIEQIHRLLKGGNVRNSAQIHEKEVEAAVAQACATLLKLEAVNVSGLPFGTNVPTHHLLATYEGIALTDIGCGHSEATLPVMPIAMPMNVGVFQVTSPTCHDPFVPLEPGMLPVAQGVQHNAIHAMLGKKLVAYEPVGRKIRVNRTSGQLGGSVTVRLLVVDISGAGDYDPLPIPQDLEVAVVKLVVQQFGAMPPHDTSTDSQDKA